jgi:site-specific DNA recombinase
MIAAIYARKSTDQSGVADEQRSVTRQIEHARDYALRKGWTVDESLIFVDDGISGAEFAARPGFLRLMNSLKPRAPFQALIMSEESRLGREAIETAYALKQIVQAGARVFFYLEDRERTLDSPTDKIMLSLTAFADELEREKGRQRTYDAMVRKARAGHVTGGRVFGYDNLEVVGADGKRSHVERRINEREAAAVRMVFEMCAAGHGVRTIAKRLNAEGEPAPRAQQGRPVGWAPSSVHAILRRSLYRGQIVWNQTRKRDQWGRKQQRDRSPEEWIQREAPELRIVSETLWTAAHNRLTGAYEDYKRRSGGRVWGRPVNGTVSPYLLTGLAQCGICGSGLSVQSRAHGRQRAHFYVCVGYHNRGRTVCPNNQALPMRRIDREVLDALRDDLLNPVVLERAFTKLRARLQAQPKAAESRVGALRAELTRLQHELARLAAAIASGAPLSSVLEAIREREGRRDVIGAELAILCSTEARALDQLADVEPEIQSRLKDWRGMLSEDTPQARQMLRALLTGRLVFTPQPDAVEFVGEGDLGSLFAGLIDLSSADLPKALASPTGFEPVFWP